MTTPERSAGLTRRALIAGLAAMPALTGAALAGPPEVSPRPPARPLSPSAASSSSARRDPMAAAERMIAEAQLGGEVAFAVADAATGVVLAARQPDLAMPPASTAKVLTTLFALAHLPRDYRFTTQLVATGPVSDGLVAGDLVLAGGGDPTLSTDQFGDMAASLRKAGIKGVTGDFRVWGGALPFLREIAPEQEEYVGYNPSVSGINLNFNRANMVWKRGGDGIRLSMDAMGERFNPAVHVVRAKIAERELPVFTYEETPEFEEWTVARPALVRDGSRWLPVRRPEAYAGDVFRTLAADQGVRLPDAGVARSAPSGTPVAAWTSDPLAIVLRDMLKYSTNLTAEVVGMTAAATLGAASHSASVAAMNRWVAAGAGIPAPGLVDHSGLGGTSRLTAREMVQVIARLGPKAGLQGLLKEIPLGEKGKPVPGVAVHAKTGTLNFVSALAGYAVVPGGRTLVFAIFTGDTARRDAAALEGSERPAGGAAWTKRSKRLQAQLIESWASAFAA